MQSFVDMHSELGTDVKSGSTHLEDICGWMGPALERLCTMSGPTSSQHEFLPIYKLCASRLATVVIGNFATKVLMQSALYGRCIQYSSQLPGALTESGPSAKNALKTISSWGQTFYLKNSPLIYSLNMQDQLRILHDHGSRGDNNKGEMIATLHAYNYALLRGFVGRLPDLKFLIEHIGESDIFVGAHPQDPRTCFKRMALAMGISLSNMVGNSRLEPMARSDTNALLFDLPKATRPLRHMEYFSTYDKASRSSNITKQGQKDAGLKTTH